MVKIEQISKSFANIEAVKSCNFEVKEGEMFGIIGPDGAGKTTLLRMITSLIVPDSGKISLWGLDPVADYKQVRHMIGYMPGKFSLYMDLTIEENLEFFATVFDTTIQENYHLIKDIYQQIEPFKKRPAGKLSGGMKQKLALSCALIHKPKLLILDEPTTGVDAVSRKEFWAMLQKLKAANITIIVSTPYMDEASLCDRIALMQNGEILTIETPEVIRNNFKKQLLGIKSSSFYKLITDLKLYPMMNSVYPFGEFLHYTDKADEVDLQALNGYLQENGHNDLVIEVIKPDIEDCFMRLMK